MAHDSANILTLGNDMGVGLLQVIFRSFIIAVATYLFSIYEADNG